MHRDHELRSILFGDVMPLLDALDEIDGRMSIGLTHPPIKTTTATDSAELEQPAFALEALDGIAQQREVLEACLRELRDQQNVVRSKSPLDEEACVLLESQENTLRGLLAACEHIAETGSRVVRKLDPSPLATCAGDPSGASLTG